MDLDDLLGGPPAKPTKGTNLFADDDLLGGAPKGTISPPSLLDSGDLLGGPTSSPTTQHTAKNTAAAATGHQGPQTPEERAAIVVALKSEMTNMRADTLTAKAQADDLQKQLEAMKLAKEKGRVGQVKAQLLVLQTAMDTTDKAIQELLPIRDQAKAKLSNLLADIAKKVQQRELKVAATKDEREQADMIKFAQEIELNRNVHNREIEALTTRATDLEELLNIPAADLPKKLVNLTVKQTEIFYAEREKKNEAEKQTKSYEDQAAALQQELDGIIKNKESLGNKDAARYSPQEARLPAPPPTDDL